MPAGLDLSRWRMALNGGEAVRAGTGSAFAETLAPGGVSATTRYPSYGMAEATLSVTCPVSGTEPVTTWFDREGLANARLAVPVAAGATHGSALVSVGRPVPGMDLRIVDDLGRQVADSALGEIVLRGPSVTTGYLDDPDATTAALR
ncbi:AMP-binding protein, partial [Streptomyces sp. NRRL S-15]|uniref:AMP-binding protein n=1 Tax=Streptomyces sp. NRRL S-15 TaxID=1463886 RepID=UPI003B634630